MVENDPLTEIIIGAAIEVHRVLGPGPTSQIRTLQKAAASQYLMKV